MTCWNASRRQSQRLAPVRPAPVYVLVLLLLLSQYTPATRGYRILSAADDPVGGTHATFEPYSAGRAGYYSDPAVPTPDRVNEGAPFSPDTPRLYLSPPLERASSPLAVLNDPSLELTTALSTGDQSDVPAWSAPLVTASTTAARGSTDTATDAAASACATRATRGLTAPSVSRPSSASASSAPPRVGRPVPPT
jgi:hypothetical protein